MTNPAVVLRAHDYQLAADALSIVPADGWWRRAACLGKDPHWWFNDDETDKAYRSWMDHQARALCWACPVRLSCLNYALVHREEHGIWGGYDFEQLRRLRGRLHVSTVRPASLIPTTRTERIVWLLARGWPAGEIAAELGVTEADVADVAARKASA